VASRRKNVSGNAKSRMPYSKDRPTLSQWLRLIAMGRSLLEAIGAAASTKAKCDPDSGPLRALDVHELVAGALAILGISFRAAPS
jgi:hypothetical protein